MRTPPSRAPFIECVRSLDCRHARRAACVLLLGFVLLSSAATAQSTAEGLLRGRVVDGVGRAVANGLVEARAFGAFAVTEADGSFVLAVEGSAVELVVSHAAFDERTLSVELGAPDLRIVLRPRSGLSEEISVVAAPLGDQNSPGSIASTVIELDDPAAGLASDIVSRVAGVDRSGQGGVLQVVSIRGVSRQRVLSHFAGMRLTSERRAGVAASFIDPFLIGQAEVLRGPASTYYGSGALGGALQLFPRRFRGSQWQFGASSVGDGLQAAAGWGDDRWSVGVAHRMSEDGEDPRGSAIFDRYEQSSAVIHRRFELPSRELEAELLVVPTVSRDLGKPNSDIPERITEYPSERHLLVRAAVRKAERYRADLWFHTHSLDTRIERAGESVSDVENSTTDLGATFERSLWWSEAGDGSPRKGRQAWQGRFGLSYFGRRGVEATEQITPFADTEPSRRFATLDGGEVDELAPYVIVNRQWRGAKLEAGGRLTWLRQSVGALRPGSRIEESRASGFLGASFPLTSSLELLANVGSGWRAPSLTERFFVGSTGRGQVIGNPRLDDERSLNVEVGLRYGGGRSRWRLATFRNDVNDYIERIDSEDGLRTFSNLDSGVIEGFEVEAETWVSPSWTVRVGGHVVDGTSNREVPLADIPPHRLFVENDREHGAWRSSLRLVWRDSKSDVASGEQPLDDALLASLHLSYALDNGLRLRLSGENLLDETYLPTADDRAVPARKRSVSLVLSWSPPGGVSERP